ATAGHRLRRRACFLRATIFMNTQVNLSIYRQCAAKDRRPIDVPISENCVWSASDGEENWLAIDPRQFDVLKVESLFASCNTGNRAFGNTKVGSALGFACRKVGLVLRHGEIASEGDGNRRDASEILHVSLKLHHWTRAAKVPSCAMVGEGLSLILSLIGVRDRSPI